MKLGATGVKIDRQTDNTDRFTVRLRLIREEVMRGVTLIIFTSLNIAYCAPLCCLTMWKKKEKKKESVYYSNEEDCRWVLFGVALGKVRLG